MTLDEVIEKLKKIKEDNPDTKYDGISSIYIEKFYDDIITVNISYIGVCFNL